MAPKKQDRHVVGAEEVPDLGDVLEPSPRRSRAGGGRGVGGDADLTRRRRDRGCRLLRPGRRRAFDRSLLRRSFLDRRLLRGSFPDRSFLGRSFLDRSFLGGGLPGCLAGSDRAVAHGGYLAVGWSAVSRQCSPSAPDRRRVRQIWTAQTAQPADQTQAGGHRGVGDPVDVVAVLHGVGGQLAQSAEQDQRKRPRHRLQVRTPETRAGGDVDQHVGESLHAAALHRSRRVTQRREFADPGER